MQTYISYINAAKLLSIYLAPCATGRLIQIQTHNLTHQFCQHKYMKKKDSIHTNTHFNKDTG